jgi:hypothetical protein
MLRAVEQMAEAARLPHSPETESLLVLITATQDRLFEVDDAHVIEWVGHGGKTAEMMLEETAAERGDAEDVQQ